MIYQSAFAHRLCLLAMMLYGTCVALPTESAELAGVVRLAVLPQSWQEDSGKVLSLADLSGQRVVLTMAYANCHRICPITIEGLKRMQASFDAKDTHAEFVVVGYDPENESPAAWRQYRRSHRLQRSNWHFLTGSVADTAKLARQLQFELWKYDEHVMHESRVLVFDVRGLLTRELGPDADYAASAQ
jgi:cytochrome oxidase Cu insertion factor (SCO1/SenC/PrrC family)